MDLQVIYDYINHCSNPSLLLAWTGLSVSFAIYYALRSIDTKKIRFDGFFILIGVIVYNYFLYLHEFKEIDNKRYSEIAKSIKDNNNHYVNSQVQHFMEDGRMLEWEYDRISEIIYDKKYNEYLKDIETKEKEIVIDNPKLFLSKIKV